MTLHVSSKLMSPAKARVTENGSDKGAGSDDASVFPSFCKVPDEESGRGSSEAPVAMEEAGLIVSVTEGASGSGFAGFSPQAVISAPADNNTTISAERIFFSYSPFLMSLL